MEITSDTARLLTAFPQLTAEQIHRFAQLYPLYKEWNGRINVISRKDIEQLYLHHVLHSLAIARFIQFLPDAEILDVGTGGGFPGIPLAILFPASRFTLVDSIGKKITVVQAVADALHLENVHAVHARAETLPGPFDFVVSRAVTALPAFAQWVWPKIRCGGGHALANGIIYLKGGELEEEMNATIKHLHLPRHHIEVTPISRWFADRFFAEKKLVYLKKI